MLRKRILAAVLTTALLATLFAGCTPGTSEGPGGEDGGPADTASAGGEEGGAGDNFNPTGFPIVNETVTKTFMINKPAHIVDPADMVTLQEYEKMTNVHIEWDVVSSDGFIERFNLVMASNSMPDAVMKNLHEQTIVNASADGSIIDLKGLIDEHSTGIKSLFEQYPATREASYSPDGNIYCLPTINTLQPNRTGHRNLWINKTWMDNLGLPMPQTLDQFVDVLRAFRDQDANGNGDPNDEYPYVLEYGGGNHISRADIFLGVWGIAPNFSVYPPTGLGYSYLHLNGDAVEAYVLGDTYKEVLQFMNMLWEEKLLDNSAFTQTSDVALSKFNSEIAGCFGLSSDDLWSEYGEHYVALAPPRLSSDVDPVIALSPTYNSKAMIITKADESPEVTLRWIDYFYTDEGSRLIGGMTEQLEGITCVRQADGSYEYTDEIVGSPKGLGMAVGEMCPLPGGGFPYWRNENNSNFIYSPKVRESVPVYQDYYQTQEAYAYPVFSLETNERVNDIRRDLEVYISECEAKFISGELSFDNWDEYVLTCQKMDIEELVGYFQEAYDNMK